MDFMFEDEVDEVGSDVEAYCPKCKADTTHVVISKYEDEIRRVQCNPCGDVHSFRKPRGEVEDDVPEPIAAKKRALIKKHSWDEFFAKYPDRNGKPYEFREAYGENTIVTHPKFGKGFVSEVMSDSKVEVTFKDARRVLVHNRKDMPGLPLAAEGDGIPSKGPKAKAVKTKAAAKESSGQAVAKAGVPGTAAPATPAAPAAPVAKAAAPSKAQAGAVTAASGAPPAPKAPAKTAVGASGGGPGAGAGAPKGMASSQKPPAKVAAGAKPAKHAIKAAAAKPVGKAAHASRAAKETSKVAAKARPKVGKSKAPPKKKR
jgi:hypothetical protein